MKFGFIKKIDRLLISSFIPPFVVTFMIAMFVLLMQTLWLYIDDIAGKGLGFFLVVELMAYKCVSLVPLALPLAILISSVMVLGNMAERYELSSFKSAGVPLFRMMKPLMLIAVFGTAFSYFCSNYLIPVANLKFGSRMYDIQRQKPTLRLDAGIFNDDFEGYAIHIGKKGRDDKSIEDVLIYDHRDANKDRLTQIVAKEGEMFATPDGGYFVMNLRDGNQYVETRPTAGRDDNSFPFVRTSFKSWNKVFDLSEFELNRTNEDLFKQNRSMMSIQQLKVAIDSIGTKVREREVSLSNHISSYFYFMDLDSTFIKKQIDSTFEREKRLVLEDSLSRTENVKGDTNKMKIVEGIKVDWDAVEANKSKVKSKRNVDLKIEKQTINKPLEEYESFTETFNGPDRNRLYNKGKTFARSIHAQAESAKRSLDRMKESKVKHIYELHTKYTMAAVCFIFLFIGAPMGAIVRKGGFGYPILISIIFFMIFVVLTIFCRKIAESFVLPADVAAWVPCMVLFPIGVFLTIKAMNDSKLFNMDRINLFFSKLFDLLKRKKNERAV